MALHLLGGVAEWRDLSREGVSRSMLNEVVEAGAAVRVRRGCYALPDADALRLAEVAWRGRATCVTALAAMALPVPRGEERLHLTRSRDRSESGRNLSTPASIRWHASAEPHGDTTVVAHALDMACRCLEPLDQLVAIDAALHRRLLLPHELPRFSVTARDRLAWLIRNADSRTRSPAETHTRIGFRRARIPFEFQVMVDGIGEVDFVVDGRLTVEVDGKDYHSDARQFVTDRRRDRAAVLQGLVPLRYTGWEAIWHTEAMVAEVWEVVRLMRRADGAARPSARRKSRLNAGLRAESRTIRDQAGDPP